MTRLPSFSGRILASLLLVALAAHATGAAGEAVPPPLGRLVDVGGHKLHLCCMGKGAPAVIVENGSSGFSIDWALVQPEVAKFTQMCTYDRAGHAWSDAGAARR